MPLMKQSEDRDARVGDFLDDKLQNAADLQNLDGLISSVLEKQELLRRQLEAAQAELETHSKTHTDHKTSIEDRAQLYAKEQIDIDRRLRDITQRHTGDGVYTQLEPFMDKLRNIEVAENYIAVLQEVEGLSNTCASQLGKSDDDVLNAYRRLYTFRQRIEPLRHAADEATPSLTEHIDRVTSDVRTKLYHAFSARMQDVLRKSSWPSRDASIPKHLQAPWEDAVGKLIELQKPDLEARESTLHENAASSRGVQSVQDNISIVLLPFQTLVHDIELKFRYHFEGDRPTNKLDRPDFFLKFITGEVLENYNDFVIEAVQPILIRHLRGTDLSMNPIYFDAQSAFITAVLPMVRHKVFTLLPQVSDQPQLLSKVMHELMSFDDVIRDDVWDYTGDPSVGGFRGLTWEVLVLKQWFPRWLEVEREFALARYGSIINDTKSLVLDYESFLPSQTVPTRAAIQVNDILEATTDTYKSLSSFSQKLRFLIDIQIAIFDRFHGRLNDALDAYLSRTSAIMGGKREERSKLAGIEGLESLCKVYGSAEYLEKKMTDEWNNNVFFIDLYAELQDRARHGGDGKTLTGDMSVAQVAQKTSSTITGDDQNNSTLIAGDTAGGLFDETAAAYARVKARSEKTIVDVLQRNVRDALHGYRGINPWASLSAIGSVPLAPTPELLPLIDYLATSLAFLRRALGTVPLRRIARSVLSAIDDLLLRQVLLTMKFSTAGAAQLEADVMAIVDVVKRCLGTSHGDTGTDRVVDSGLGRLLEGVRLVGLPVKSSKSVDDGVPGLWDVEKRLFSDNDGARAVLEELGIERLEVREARDVVQRRVELHG